LYPLEHSVSCFPRA